MKDTWKINLRATSNKNAIELLKIVVSAFELAVATNNPMDSTFAQLTDSDNEIICN